MRRKALAALQRLAASTSAFLVGGELYVITGCISFEETIESGSAACRRCPRKVLAAAAK
jgi:hypothetical protein